MAYINDFGNEIDSKRSGVILSDPRDTKTLYMRAYWDPDEEWLSPGGNDFNKYRRVIRGDPVVMCKTASLVANNKNGAVCGYDGTIPEMYGSVAIVGIALADAVYDPRTHLSQPFPVMVDGTVIATVPAAQIQQRGLGQRGHYYAGEYISATGVVDSDDMWLTSAQLVIGQIVAPKTDVPEDVAVISRTYKRFETEAIGLYYHVPVRLTLSPLQTAGYIPPSPDPERTVRAQNIGDVPINPNSVVQITRRNGIWCMVPSEIGGFSNGVCRADAQVQPGDYGAAQLTGVVVYVRNALMDVIARSPRARSTPFGMRMLTRLQATKNGGPVPNDDPLDDYVVGMGVTEDLFPITTSVPGNKFGTIVDINKDDGSIAVQIEAVATHAPANTTVAELSTDDIAEDTPVGTALIENPYTHRFVPCRCNTDNVDGILMEAEELVAVHGWGLADYHAFYGPGVWMDENGKIWRAFKSFAKGVYKRVIKPVAKWAISIAAPIASSYVGPMGEILASHVSTKCGQLLDMIPPAQLQAAKNGGYMYTTFKGKQLPSDVGDPVLQVFTDNAAHYGDSHPNATYVHPIDAPTANASWTIGDAYWVNTATGKAVKVDSYEMKIAGVANWEPHHSTSSANAGWHIAGIHKGHIEKRTNALYIGAPVAYDYTDATERLSQGLATAIIGYVKEIWQPSTSILNDVKSGLLSADNALPNVIIEVNPEYHYARDPSYTSIVAYEEGVQKPNKGGTDQHACNTQD